MASQQPLPLLFLDQRNADEASTGRSLSTVAKAHASRQGHVKSSRSRSQNLRFVSVFPRVAERGTPSTHTVAGGSSNLNDMSRDKNGREVSGRARRSHYGWTGKPYATSTTIHRIGDWDPFDSFAAPSLSKDESFMLHYAFTTTWSAFGESECIKRMFVQHWMWRTMDSPATLYAQLLGSSTHFLISRSMAVELRDQAKFVELGLRSKLQAISSLRWELARFQNDKDQSISESAFMAIFVLAVHGSFDLSSRPEPHPFSPLATYRDMHIYGRMSFGEEHMNALYSIIDKRGGFGNIDQHAFGCVIHLLDMLYNARTESGPRFPCTRELQPIVHTEDWRPDVRATRLLHMIGSAFHLDLGDGCFADTIRLDSTMISCLRVLAELSAALDHFGRSDPGAPSSLDVLANNCDWVSHTLLSRPSYLTIESTVDDSFGPFNCNLVKILREICRVASLIYLSMVILPTPPHTQIKYRHAARMLPLIDGLQHVWGEDERVDEFLIWATMQGAIVSRFTDLHSRYLAIIVSFRQRRCLTQQVTLQKLKRYLWLDSVCDPPMEVIWLESEGHAQLY